ncbi:hypothetical protein Salat_0465100 [Sesamum alatum]|uniref:Senescence regulator n=1 Tax=Sesamum alatum TaxID=300844 RepID=A0AAE2D0B8_9LAMI|nr:hypothetical protein Salat_0465100 [Sesamum alatum]
MEEVGGGATRLRHQRSSPSHDRFLGVFRPPSSSAESAVELSEHDIFNTPSGSSSPSPTHSSPSNPTRNVQNHNRCHYGILSALNDNLKTRSGSGNGPVFNHKASTSASLSSSPSSSPATSTSSRMMIPKRPPPPPPPVERMRIQHQSAPVNMPVVRAALTRRPRDLEDIVSEEEEEEGRNGVILPPHEVVAARHSPMLACSVLEGAGRTLKGRDLRQVRNAVWRKTGFID